MSWATLPTEIRWLVLDNLRDFKCRQYESPQRRRERRETSSISQAAYASVCREWGTFFELANFEKLILYQHYIAVLGEIIPRCGALIRGIWLRIELPSYDCSLCDQPESVEEDKINKFLFTDAVWALFGILSQLNKTHHLGITLELSAHSPSLVDHYAQELGCMINNTAWHTLGGTQSPRDLNREAVCDRAPGTELGVRGQGQIFYLPKGRDFMCALALRGDALTKTSRRQILGQHGRSDLDSETRSAPERWLLPSAPEYPVFKT